MKCEICEFNNPKATVTAVILKDNKILLLRRNEEPFKDMLDLPGGYVNAWELPEDAIRRELAEELDITDIKIFELNSIASEAEYKDQKFAIHAMFYLIDFDDEINLNDENSEYSWVALKDLVTADIAFMSNETMAAWVKEKFTFDLSRVAELLKQLDSSFEKLNEYNFYRSMLEGHMETVYEGELLIGMGWIYPRQTALRHQAVVEDLIVDEAYRGRGLGAKIMLALHDWAKGQGVEVVELTTNPKRIRANELYKELGYKLHETNHYLFNL